MAYLFIRHICSGGGGLPSFPDAVLVFATLHRIHALHTVNTAVTHRLASANMRAPETTARLQNHLNTHKKHTKCNNSEGD